MENYTCPIQLLSSGLHIVDSNGVHRDDTIYEIINICGELDNQKLLYIDVYDDSVHMTTRFYNSADFILMYRSRIEEAFHHPLNMEVTAVATKDIVQADIIYPESQIVPRTQCSLQDIAANNSGSEIVPSVQSYTMNTQNIMANLVHVKPGKPAKKEGPPNAAIEAKKFLNCKRVITCKGGIYFYTGTYYKMLDKASLHKMICSVLHEDITANGRYAYVEDVQKFIIAYADEVNLEKSKIGNTIAFSNCVLDLNTFCEYTHDPRYHNTYALSVSYMSCNCHKPVFDRYICDLAGNNDILIRRIWEALGLLLSNDVSAKRIVVLSGKGNTGKSVFGKIVEAMIADGNVTCFSPQKLTDRFVGTSLVNSAVNICSDLPSIPIDAATAAILKNLSGGDTVSGEVKYLNNFTYTYQGQLLFGTNYPLKLTYLDQAFADRLLMIPCLNPIPKELQDKDLLEHIRPELPMIASRAVRAFAEVRKNGYVFTGDNLYSVSAEEIYTKSLINVSVEKDGYTAELFARQMCEVTSDINDFVPISELYEKYCEYCKKNNLSAIPNSNTFSRELHNALPGIVSQKKRVNGKPVNVWCNIKLKSE